jgi:hypothetical protein
VDKNTCACGPAGFYGLHMEDSGSSVRMRRLRIFFAEGPGDVIQAHRHWMNGEESPEQMCLTFSGEFADFCREIDTDAYIIASNEHKQIFQNAKCVIGHYSSSKGA